ncbi:MAG TPA: S41 family peptidase [Chloroflexota bacterium]|nr:S41 family peptidase [Chloroflexota bacterium]
MERAHAINFTRLRAVMVGLLLCALALPLLYQAASSAASPAQAALPRCKALNTPKDLITSHPSDLAIVQQGYQCILRHYISGKSLDDRILLRGAFNSLTQSLGAYAAGITLPALSGNRDADWRAFATAYDALAAHFKPLPVVQQLLAEQSLLGMASSLHDDHTSYLPSDEMKLQISQLTSDAPVPSFGFVTSPFDNTTTSLYLTDIFPSTPAAAAGLKPGDTLETVNGHALFANGQPDVAGLLAVLFPHMGTALSLTVLRPVSGANISVRLMPKSLITPATTARLLPGSIAYVKLYVFTTKAATQVTAALKRLQRAGPLHGVILDLRGNEGGDADQAVRILSAFVHDAVVGYDVNGAGHRHPDRTNNKVALLHKPVVVLTDGGSASSSELVAGAVRDLHLGLLVGSRTAGALAGAEFYGLSDGSGLEITEVHVLGAKAEKVDGIGIAPNQQVTTTAADLSAGRDPVIDQAAQDLASAASQG